jgi:capsular polysaccharide biosynthesis protein
VKAAARVADLRLESQSNDAGMTALGEASAPEKPYFPNIPVIIGASAGFGLGIGVLAALLIELLGRRVRSKEDLESAIDAPVFAVIESGMSLPGRLRRGYQEIAQTTEEREVAAS